MVLQQDQTDQLSGGASGEAGEDSLEQLGPDRTLRNEMGLACRKWKRRSQPDPRQEGYVDMMC